MQRRPSGYESTFDRFHQTGVLQIAALPGERPYFSKNSATGAWSGLGMLRDIAKSTNAPLESVDSTYNNSVPYASFVEQLVKKSAR